MENIEEKVSDGLRQASRFNCLSACRKEEMNSIYGQKHAYKYMLSGPFTGLLRSVFTAPFTDAFTRRPYKLSTGEKELTVVNGETEGC
jgi:hypothetical protein